jgi:hypothetical protein
MHHIDILKVKFIDNSNAVCSKCAVVGDIINVVLSSSGTVYRNTARPYCCLIRICDTELVNIEDNNSMSEFNFTLIAVGGSYEANN